MKNEIISGIRNAMERGQSLEQAMTSFVNAGYNPAEVRAAGQEISAGGGASGIAQGMQPEDVQQSTGQQAGQMQPQAQQEQVQQERGAGQQLPKIQQKPEKKGRAVLIIAVIVSLLIFLSALGFLIYTLIIK